MAKELQSLADLMADHDKERIAAMNTPEALAREAATDAARRERFASLDFEGLAPEGDDPTGPADDDECCDICGDELNDDGDCNYCDGDGELD